MKPNQAEYRLARDPASGEFSLMGEWKNSRGFKKGSLVFHADGSFFVEQDIVCQHPRLKSWFIEALNAWGKGEDIRTEPRLLALP